MFRVVVKEFTLGFMELEYIGGLKKHRHRAEAVNGLKLYARCTNSTSPRQSLELFNGRQFHWDYGPLNKTFQDRRQYPTRKRSLNRWFHWTLLVCKSNRSSLYTDKYLNKLSMNSTGLCRVWEQLPQKFLTSTQAPLFPKQRQANIWMVCLWRTNRSAWKIRIINTSTPLISLGWIDY